MKSLNLKGVAYALASNCTFKSIKDDSVVLILEVKHEDLKTENAEQRLKEAISNYVGKEIELQIQIDKHQSETPAQTVERERQHRLQHAEEAIKEDSIVQAFQENFGAQIVPGSVKPKDEQ